MPKVKDLIKELKRCNPDSIIAHRYWDEDDVLDLCTEYTGEHHMTLVQTITRQEAREVLDEVHYWEHWDPNTSDDIYEAITQIKEKRSAFEREIELAVLNDNTNSNNNNNNSNNDES